MDDQGLSTDASLDSPAGMGLPPLPDDQMSAQKMEDALRAVSTSWLEKIKQSEKHKRPFTEDAREAMNFFDGNGDWFWRDRDKGASFSKIAPPSFRMCINKAFEAVKLFGSVIYARNPVRTVNPRAFPVVSPISLGIDPNQPPQMDPMTGMPMPDPMVETFIQTSNQIAMEEERRKTISSLVEGYLNYTPVELNLKEHSRRVVDEAIIKGLGVWWTELMELPGVDNNSYGIVGSFYDSCDNIQWDPDADEQEDILWCARRCIHPVDQVARKYGLNKEDLKGHLESYVARSQEQDRDYKNKKRNGKTNDLIVYWKIYSKTGFGHTLKGSPKEFAQTFDALGENCYIVVAEGVNFPLNAPKEIAMEQPDETGLPNTLFTRTRWPIPFYADSNNGWPFVPLQFHRKPGYSWPISHLKPGMAELKFMNWALSFLATRIMTSCKTLVGVNKAAEQDLKDQLLKHEEGGFSLIELSETLGRSVNDVVSVFQMPTVTPDIWQVIQAVSDMFDKRVGLTELVFGMTRNQFRSAAEAQVKSEQISVRPDDMANALEDAMSLLARREALAARWLLQPQDVVPILGPLGAEVWQQQIQNMDISQLAREFDYRIEAGSARKPNKAGKIEQLNMALQTIGPVVQQLIPQGIVGPWNALISDWAKSLDINPQPYLIPEPPPPVAPPESANPSTPPQAGGSPAESGGPPPGPPDAVPPELSP